VSSAEKQIRERVDAFVKDLESLIRQAAVEAVAQALGVGTAAVHAQLGSGASGRHRDGEGRSAARRAIASARPDVAPKPKSRAVAGRRVRRSAAELEALGNAIIAYVSKNPGQRAEQIKKALGLDDADWALPVKKLVDEGQLHTVGEKRATAYSVRARLGEG
jgi:hypothetical protein